MKKSLQCPAVVLRLVLRVILCAPLLAVAGYKPGRGWPEISTPFFHAGTPDQADTRIARWKIQTGFVVRGYRDTGSMQPFLRGGRELLAMESCRPLTALTPGMMVQFDRGDQPAVLHYIAAISGDGRHLYLSGVNNRYSDGWFPRSRVAFIVREIITQPQPDFIAARTPAPGLLPREANIPYRRTVASPILIRPLP